MHPALLLEGAAQTFPCPGPMLCLGNPYGSYYHHRIHFSKIPSGNFEVQDLLLPGPGRYTACLRATQ